jgi:hypothetical protein
LDKEAMRQLSEDAERLGLNRFNWLRCFASCLEIAKQLLRNQSNGEEA